VSAETIKKATKSAQIFTVYITVLKSLHTADNASVWRYNPSTIWLDWVEFNAPPDTVLVISKAVFTANHLTDTDKTI